MENTNQNTSSNQVPVQNQPIPNNVPTRRNNTPLIVGIALILILIIGGAIYLFLKVNGNVQIGTSPANTGSVFIELSEANKYAYVSRYTSDQMILYKLDGTNTVPDFYIDCCKIGWQGSSYLHTSPNLQYTAYTKLQGPRDKNSIGHPVSLNILSHKDMTIIPVDDRVYEISGWSPDSEKLLYYDDGANIFKVFSLSSQTTKEVRVPWERLKYIYKSFIGNNLLLFQNADNRDEFYLLDIESGKIINDTPLNQAIRNDLRNNRLFTLSANKLVYTKNIGDARTELLLLDIAPNREAVIDGNAAKDVPAGFNGNKEGLMGYDNLTLSPDEQSFYFKKNRRYIVNTIESHIAEGNYFVYSGGTLKELRDKFVPIGFATNDTLLLKDQDQTNRADLYLYWITNNNYKKIHSNASTWQ